MLLAEILVKFDREVKSTGGLTYDYRVSKNYCANPEGSFHSLITV